MADRATKTFTKTAPASPPAKGAGKPAPAPAQPKAEPPPASTPAARASDAFGVVTSLLMQSPTHRHIFLGDLEWLVVPPLVLQQFALFHRDRKPIGYASWALVNEEVEKRLIKGNVRLAPKEWRSGDRLWLIDLVAPQEAAERFLGELRGRVLAGREVKMLRPGPGGVPTVETWPATAAAAAGEKQKTG